MIQLKIIHRNNYFSIVSTSKYSKGDTILKLEGTINTIPDKYSIQISETEHILPHESDFKNGTAFYMYINHNCIPNGYFNIEKKGLIALKDIEAGEEITYNYNTTEYDMCCPFTCNCRSNTCIKEIRGFKHLSVEQKKELLSCLAPHLKKYI